MPGRQDWRPCHWQKPPFSSNGWGNCTHRETHFLQREALFLFEEFNAKVSGGFENYARVGGGVSGGLMANVTDNWKWPISGGYLDFPLGDHCNDVYISVHQWFTVAKNFAFQSTFTHDNRDNEVLAIFHGYF